MSLFTTSITMCTRSAVVSEKMAELRQAVKISDPVTVKGGVGGDYVRSS